MDSASGGRGMRLFMTPSVRIFGSALLVAAALSGCGGKAKKDAKAVPAAAPAGAARNVTVATVESRTLTGGITSSGLLVSREEAAVSAEISGYRVLRVMADMGSMVSAGQPLVVLDDTLLRSQIDQQTAVAAQSDVAAQEAESQAARVAGMDNAGLLSQEQIEQRRFQAKSARAAANAQAAGVRDLKTRQSKMTVTAPVGGLVLERTVRPGDLSGTGGSPMFRIARDDLIELEAQMAEGDVASIRLGQSVQVTLPSGHLLQGTVRLIGPRVDPQTKLGQVRIALPRSSELRPGGFGRAVFGSAVTSALTVPEAALRYDADGVTVMVLDAGNKVSKVKVRAGRHGGGFVELVQGPPAGTRVLLGAASFVLEGDVVNPVAASAAPAAAPAKPVAR